MTDHLEAYEPVVAEMLAEADAPGAVLAVSVQGNVSVRAIGYADLARSEPIAPDAVFGLYSVTKMLIATLMLALKEGDAPITLDDTLQLRVPEFPYERPVQIRQVLNHTSGLPSYGQTSEYQDAVRQHPGEPWSRREFLRRTLGEDLLFIPGHGWRYSNIGYMLLRQILEEETGLSLARMVEFYLGRPLGLSSLSGVASLTAMANLTPGYSTLLSGNDTVENVIPRYHPGWVAHGLAVGTAEDVVRFLDLLLVERRVIQSDLVDEMLVGAPVAENHPWMVKPAYGLGVMMDTASPHGVVAGHTGGGPGYSTAAYSFANVAGKPVSVVALVNRDGSDIATDLVFTLARELAAAG